MHLMITQSIDKVKNVKIFAFARITKVVLYFSEAQIRFTYPYEKQNDFIWSKGRKTRLAFRQKAEI